MKNKQYGKIKDFVAIDVETANYLAQICQIGIAVVRHGEIVETRSWLVQPPGNHYEKGNIKTHGITAERTKNERFFNEIWPELEPYLMGQKLVAHNSSTEKKALERAFEKDYQEIMVMNVDYKNIICSMKPFGQKGLEAVCQAYGIDFKNHHDAEYDALHCAKVYLKYLEGALPDWSLVLEEPKKEVKPKRSKRKLSIPEINKLETIADENSPFYNRNVLVTGEFVIDGEEIDRTDIEKTLRIQYGAILKANISKNVHFILIGESPGPDKIKDVENLIYNGFNIRKLYEEDLYKILKGEWEGYHVSEEIVKDLNLTYEHYTKKCLKFENGLNVIAGKEMFQGKGLSGEKDLFAQITGNLGANSDYQMFPETNLCVLSDSTIEKLKNGEKDNTITCIEACYNSRKARTFELSFISEGEILRFVKERIERIGDESTGYYYRRYLGEIEKND